MLVPFDGTERYKLGIYIELVFRIRRDVNVYWL